MHLPGIPVLFVTMEIKNQMPLAVQTEMSSTNCEPGSLGTNTTYRQLRNSLLTSPSEQGSYSEVTNAYFVGPYNS